MTNELPEYPEILLPPNIRGNPYLSQSTKAKLVRLAASYMKVSSAVRFRWTYPLSDIVRCRMPEPELGTRYLREYKKIFVWPLEDIINDLDALLSGNQITYPGYRIVRDIKEKLSWMQDAMARAVWAAMQSNFQAAERMGATHPPVRRSFSSPS